MPTFEEYFKNNYNTNLSPENETRYQNWLKAVGQDPAHADDDYDMRGYWLNGGYKETSREKGVHFTDTYKKPNHITFSDQSKFNGTQSPWNVPYQGGTWADDGSTYTPSQTMLDLTHNIEVLKQYMKQNEPNTRLIIPARRPR